MFNKKICAKTIIYNSAIEEELEWRRDENNAHDVAIVDELLQEVRSIGWGYKFFVDIINRDNKDKELLNLLLKYIGRFDDDWFSASLVGVVGQKGNTDFTKTILESYRSLSRKSKQHHGAFYDNALSRIKDKRFIGEYLELLEDPSEAMHLPFTMAMLGKWHIEKAKQCFLCYLRNDGTEDRLVYISMNGLSYYPDVDGEIELLIGEKLKSDNKDIVMAATKAIKRINKAKNQE